jgi:hypothetical protein
MPRSLLATAIAALALGLPTVTQADRGGVPNKHSNSNPPGLSKTSTPQAKKPCPDKNKGKQRRKGETKGHKRGANRGRKCGLG